MSLDGVYDPGNVFARVVRGELPKHALFEDGTTLAFMDVFPQARGHCLVIHKTSLARTWLDAERETLADIAITVQTVARAARAALNPDGLVITQYNGEAAGQTVFHLHVHIIPRWRGEVLGRHAATPADGAELAELARQIRAHLPA